MNNYETVFIVTPVLSDAQVKEVADKFQGVITENGGQIVNERGVGLEKARLPDSEEDHRILLPRLSSRVKVSIVNTLETQYRRDERIIRFLNFQAGQVRRRVLGETSCKTF